MRCQKVTDEFVLRLNGGTKRLVLLVNAYNRINHTESPVSSQTQTKSVCATIEASYATHELLINLPISAHGPFPVL